eukprot:jgi/Hompol1/5629/HPOL_001995-RA
MMVISNDPYEKIAQAFSNHLRKQTQDVCADQKRLEENIVKLDQFVAIITNTIVQRRVQMETTVENLTQ